jgi:hypothetical protein
MNNNLPPVEQKMNLSFSAYQAINTCGFQYYLKYIARLQAKTTSINLAIGKVVDELVSNYLIELAYGRFWNPEDHVDELWRKHVAYSNNWKLSTYYTMEHYYVMCKEFAKQIPEAWHQSGLSVVRGTDGAPMVQQRIKHVVGGIRMTSILDILCYSNELDAPVVIDVKCVASQCDEGWLGISEQLGTYALASEVDPRSPFEKVQFGGFWEAVKRKPRLPSDKSKKALIGPSFSKPVIGKLNERTRNELPMRYRIAQDRINRGEFFAQPGQAFNTPCQTCDFAAYCQSGDKSELCKKPEWKPKDSDSVILQRAV